MPDTEDRQSCREPLEATVIGSPRTVTLAQSLVLLLVPHGGQHTARRNAWAGMSADAARGRDRREAQAAVELASAAQLVRAAR